MAEAELLQPRRTGRRTVLRAAMALPALAGCAGLRSSVRVAVPWSGWELARFRDVLDAFTTDTGLGTEVVALGDDIGAVLGAKASGAPDVVMLPRPGLVDGHMNQLEAVDFAWQQPPQFSDSWRRLVYDKDNGRLFGVPFKAANKSVLWYRKGMLELPPTNWSDWMDVCQKLINDGRVPLALGAADGWPLSDLFENILLQDPLAYQMAKSKPGWQGPVRAALQMLGELLSKDGVLVGGADRALITQFEDSVLQVFEHGEAAMVVAPDFAYPVIERYARLDDVELTQFPGLDSTVMAGGDIAVLPTPASKGGRRLIEWLATRDAAEPWASLGGFLAAHQDVPNESYPDPRLATLAGKLREEFEFDLSDELGAAAGDVLLRALQDFLASVGDGRADQIEDAAQIVMDQVAQAVS